MVTVSLVSGNSVVLPFSGKATVGQLKAKAQQHFQHFGFRNKHFGQCKQKKATPLRSYPSVFYMVIPPTTTPRSYNSHQHNSANVQNNATPRPRQLSLARMKPEAGALAV